MRTRILAGLTLALLIVATATGQVPALKDPPAGTPKEMVAPEPPTQIKGKDLNAYLKDLNDRDPVMRELALRFLPAFGMPARTLKDKAGNYVVAKAVINMMKKPGEDPAVRYAAYDTAAALGFEDEADVKEAGRILAAAADEGVNGGTTRLHAVKALAAFGPRAEMYVSRLIGPAAKDITYETRRAVAATLGAIGRNPQGDPSPLALHCLTHVLMADDCAMVRVEAMQALVNIGPPMLPTNKKDALTEKDRFTARKPDVAAGRVYTALIKRRLGIGNPPTKPIETDKQVEIWGRLVLIRFDPDETNEENLEAFAKYVRGNEIGPKLQGLMAMGFIGDVAEKKITDIMACVDHDDIEVVNSAVSVIVHLGEKGKPYLDEMKKKLKEREDRVKTAQEKAFFAQLSSNAEKLIKESKSTSPGAAPPPAVPPANKP